MRAGATDRHATAMALVKEREATGAAGRTATTMAWVKDKAAEVLSEASQRGRVMEVKRLLDCGVDVNSKDEAGAAALHWAVAYNQPDVVKLLLARQETRLDIADNDGSTPLHLACRYNRSDLIPLFCQDSRCTRDLLNKKEPDFGETPLMQAVLYGRLRSVKEMVKVGGVEFSHKNKKGKSALDIAREKKHESIFAILDLEILRERRENMIEKSWSLKEEIERIEDESEDTKGHLLLKKQSVTETENLLEEMKKEMDEAEKIFLEKKRQTNQMQEKLAREIKSVNDVEDLIRNQDEALVRKRKELSENESIINEQREKLQKLCGADKIIPECPVCLVTMTSSTKIYTCKNGHEICGTCKPRTRTCATCRDKEGYICRNIMAERMIRTIHFGE